LTYLIAWELHPREYNPNKLTCYLSQGYFEKQPIRGNMARIRVDTDDLKNRAKNFASAADAFTKAGDDILATAMSLPSYEGQLSGPARAAAYEIQRQNRDIKVNLLVDADSLKNTLLEFEAMDTHTIGVFSQCQDSLLITHSPWVFDPIYSKGTSYLGYNWDPNHPDVMIFCMYGVCRMVIVTDQNKDILKNFRDDVDDYNRVSKACYDAWRASLEYSTAIAVAIGTTAITEGTGGLVLLSLIYTIPKYDQANKDYYTNAQLMVDDTHKVANDWNLLTGNNLDGYQGDPNLYPYPNPYMSKPGEGEAVYDPPVAPISSETPEPG
jgi:hypothetical protein